MARSDHPLDLRASVNSQRPTGASTVGQDVAFDSVKLWRLIPSFLGASNTAWVFRCLCIRGTNDTGVNRIPTIDLTIINNVLITDLALKYSVHPHLKIGSWSAFEHSGLTPGRHSWFRPATLDVS